MEDNDVQLIYRVLSGDDEAFTALVRKHQKSVHALVWRRVGDFHFAEEITQDAFLRVYKQLPTLKDPNQFFGWLYVITDRLCKDWLKKNKSLIKSVEDVPMVEMQRTSYERYVSEEKEQEAHAFRQELVNKLLGKLPESERTVMTLYYLGEMTAKEISKFLGVSVNTITSRLQRARKRLQKDEELLVQETLGGVQLSDSLTENIARKVADVKLAPPVNWKPFLPWIAFGIASVLVLLLSASSQYLLRFQKPYSFEAQSEPTVAIIDAPVVLDANVKPAVRSQAGRAVVPSKSSGDSVQVSESVLDANVQNELVRFSASPWAQTSGPRGGSVHDIFATAAGTLYAFSSTGTYRLAANATRWVPVEIDIPTRASRVPMAEHEGTLYLVSNEVIFASTDAGETWNRFCDRPEGSAVGIVITGEAQAEPTMYLALQEKGVFQATNAGEQWRLLNNGLVDRSISAIAAIGDIVFAGTDIGLYRLYSGIWERLLADAPGPIYSLVVSEGNVYVGTGPDFVTLQQIGSKPVKAEQIKWDENSSVSKVFHSDDLGASWTEITPMDGSDPIIAPFGINLLVTGRTILAQGVSQFRSRDGGKTWIDLGFGMNSSILTNFPSVATDEKAFYKVGTFGIRRTTDGGESWQLFMDGIVGTGIQDLVATNNRIYAHTKEGIFQSTDGGESWKGVRIDFGEQQLGSRTARTSRGNFPLHSKLVVAGNVFYGISASVKGNMHIFRLSVDDNVIVPVQGVPDFEVAVPSTNDKGAKRATLSDRREKADDLYVAFRRKHERVGAFVVSGETFYVEYKRKLFRWQPGDLKWKDLGLTDTSEQPDHDSKFGFKLAVSGETVYVGKRSGDLFQSIDSGNSWRDITLTLPLRFTYFNEIVFAGSTVYIATDAGVLASETGVYWRVINDKVVIDRFAVDGATIYGVGDTGVYRLDIDGDWEQLSPGVPGKVLSLVVDRNRLYVATERRGMFHISLDAENYLAND